MTTLLDDSKYTDEEYSWQKMSPVDIELWDWKRAHSTPQPRTLASYDFESQLGRYPRFLRNTYTSGVEVIFNYFQQQGRKVRDRPHVGRDTSFPNQIWMAFYPSNIDYRGTQFQSTAISNLTLRQAIEQTSPDRFCLSSFIVSSWDLLERRLHSIVQSLEIHLDFPQPVDPPLYPSRWRYAEQYRIRDDALHAARKARNAFTYLQAYLSFLVSFWHHRDGRRSLDTLALWLANRHDLDYTWMTMLLKFHPIAYTDKVTRLGMTISSDSPWIPYLPIFLECNVQIGVLLDESAGLIPMDPQSPRFQPYLRGAVLLHEDPKACACDVCQHRLLPIHPLLPNDPVAFITSREEDWLNHCTVMNLSPQQRAPTRRLHEQSFSYFDQEGWNLYEWIHVQDCYQRCAVPRSLTQAALAAYPPTSRYFSLLHHEIDLCNDFPPPNIPLDRTETPPCYPLPSQLVSEAYRDDEGDGHDSPIPLTFHLPNPPTWKRTLQLRLGFDCNTDVSYLSALTPQPPQSVFAPTPRGLNKSLQVLGLLPSTLGDCMSPTDRTLCTFPLSILSSRDLNLSTLPAQFDIAMRGLIPLPGHFQIQLIQHTDGSKVVHRFALGLPERPMKDQHFVLVVDGLTLLEIIRRGWTCIMQTACNLARLGIRFFTARYYHPSTSPKIRPVPRDGLAVLECETISVESYRYYEQQRDNFLRSPRGALALKEGGFVARLARDVIKVRTVTVAQPPSKHAAEFGRPLGRVKEGYVIIADYIEHAEMDLILGRFLRFVSVDVQNGITLWPTMAAWDAMGVNTSAWNDAAEDWYQRKLQLYTSPDTHSITPHSSRVWRERCKGLAKTREIWKRYGTLATEYIRRELS